MYIPTKWVRATGIAQMPDGRQWPATAWGWGDDASTASSKAKKRLQNILDRLRRGERLPDKYSYDNRPVREEILQVIDRPATDKPEAIVTRNRHGVQVLNTSRMLFLDIDLLPYSGLQRLLAKIGLGKDNSEEGVLTRLRETLQQSARATFRIYRTAGGLRVMAVNRDFDPTGREAKELMKATDTDPAFSRLCAVQDSFRARLSPKPWRCNSSSPPVEYPRDDEESRRQFASWLGAYKSACNNYATCRYLETIGNDRPASFARASIELHDRMTRCTEALPLA
ncbi:MAG: hypothetical protein OER80_00110 [Gammaproteobacteria bacterium]|nr:hypothetical protein [Gammaproteobacteria bacterium]MDH3768180.1 hypothetical protein [Gammaproteobacteria bacterium]